MEGLVTIIDTGQLEKTVYQMLDNGQIRQQEYRGSMVADRNNQFNRIDYELNSTTYPNTPIFNPTSRETLRLVRRPGKNKGYD